jgi:Tol biopolymer transport system component
MAQPFDADRRELTGRPFRVADEVRQPLEVDHRGDFSASANGVLVYRSGATASTQLAWMDRAGRHAGSVGTPALYGAPTLSPDERQVAVVLFDRGTPTSDIWLLDLSVGTSSRFTVDPAADFEPVWSPDGTHIVFASNRRGSLDLYQKRSDGTGREEWVLDLPGAKHPDSWSTDGRFIIYSTLDAKTKWDLWVWPQFGDRRPVAFLRSEHSEGQSQISPDGRWIAYVSNESGRFEVYVRTFPAGERKLRVSVDGGADPRWRRDGQELFYVGADRNLTSVAVKVGSTFEVGKPRALFDTRVEYLWEDARNHYDVTADGQRFLVMTPVEAPTSSPLTVVMNWGTQPRR